MESQDDMDCLTEQDKVTILGGNVMGLYIECEVVCDNCGHYENEKDISPSKFKKEMIEKGWKIGELTFCPECAKAIKGQHGVCY